MKFSKHLKRAAAGFMAVAMTIGFAGCGVSNPYSSLDLSEYIKVKEYKGLEVEKTKAEKVKKSDVTTRVESDLSEEAVTKVYTSDEKLQDGDTVNINYTGRIDGEEFEGGSAENKSLEIGSGTFIEDFENGLIGKPVGKEFTIKATFPDDYDESSLAGQKAEFTVKVNSATRSVTPTEEEYAQDNGYDSVKDYEKSVEKELKKEARETAESTNRTAAMDAVCENCKVKKYPADIVARYVKMQKKQMENYAEQYGTDFATLISYYGYSSKKEWRQAAKKECRAQVEAEMAACVIAENEDIMPDSDQVKEIKADFEDNGYDDETFEEEYGFTMDEYASIQATYNNAADFVLDHSKSSKSSKSSK